MDLASTILQRSKLGVKRPEVARIRHSTFEFSSFTRPSIPSPTTLTLPPRYVQGKLD
jgi:hypothetical protein